MLRCSALLAALALALASSAPAAAQTAQGEELLLGSGARALHGTLLMPRRTPSAEPVLILAGSGPTDRDGNNPMGVAAQPYRLLAEALAARGVPTLRVDKRGIAASAGAGAGLREEELRIGSFADDARAWAARLRVRTGARCVWLLGHSEGGLHALLAAQRNGDVCGIILIAAPGRPVGEALREQLRAGLAGNPLLERALAITAELEAGRTVPAADVPAPLLALFRPSVQPFFISMLAVDPAALVRDYAGPVLVVQGTTDLQVALADAQRLGAARPGVRTALIEGMNHVLKTAPADREANVAAYRDPSLPLAPGLVDAIVGFIRDASPASAGSRRRNRSRR
jgi:pimeloyl-ACP methyl ester carboxylesterase